MLNQLITKAKAMGIHTEIQTFLGEGYHWYDQQSNTIMLDNTAENIGMIDIIHEYIHHLQWTGGYRQQMINELNTREYNARSFEYHAEIVALHYEEFIVDGQLNIHEILSYYDDIIAYFNENGDCIN